MPGIQLKTTMPTASASRPRTVTVQAQSAKGSQQPERSKPTQADLEKIPCPVLRAGVQHGYLTPDASGRVSLGQTGEFVSKLLGVPKVAGAGIALIANGATGALANGFKRSFKIYELGTGPIMKKGPDGQPGGSRIFDVETGKFVPAEFNRLAEFAKSGGPTQPAFSAADLEAFRKRNLEERGGNGFKNDQFSKLEFPALGKAAFGPEGNVSVSEVKALFEKGEFPAEMQKKLDRPSAE